MKIQQAEIYNLFCIRFKTVPITKSGIVIFKILRKTGVPELPPQRKKKGDLTIQIHDLPI
jgi:hypothetical protein